MDLSLRVRKEGDCTIVDVGGELELHNAPQLREELRAICDVDAPRLVVDLSHVSFIDSSGIGVLVGGLKRAREHGGTFALVCPQPRVRRVFEITGLLQAIPIFESLPEALKEISPNASVAT